MCITPTIVVVLVVIKNMEIVFKKDWTRFGIQMEKRKTIIKQVLLKEKRRFGFFLVLFTFDIS